MLACNAGAPRRKLPTARNGLRKFPALLEESMFLCKRWCCNRWINSQALMLHSATASSCDVDTNSASRNSRRVARSFLVPYRVVWIPRFLRFILVNVRVLTTDCCMLRLSWAALVTLALYLAKILNEEE